MAVADPERRPLYEHEHREFRAAFRRFLAEEVVPRYAEWETAGIVPREVFAAAGAHGFVGMAIPEEHGGAGVADFRFNAVLGEEMMLAGVPGFGIGLTLQNDVCLPYLLAYANDEQRSRWLPGVASGEAITAIAMTEPDTGSDLAGIRATARREGDVYVLSGSKIFITNGVNADLVIVAAKTDPRERHRGLSLLVVERGADGFTRGRNLDKLGLHAQDTAELFFDEVRVPAENLLGSEGEAFRYLTANLAQERLSIAVSAVAGAAAALAWTVDFVRDRRAFGTSVGAFQHTRFALADVRTEIAVGQAFVDACVLALNRGELSAERAAMAKLWCTEMQGRAVDACVQLHGGYGYMLEYPVARAYADARASRIYAGTNEIMREIVGRSLQL